MRRIYLSTLRLWKSLGGKVGLTEDKLSSLSYPTHSGVLYTGDIEKFPFTNWNKYSSFIIEQDQPYPMMLLSAILLSEEEEISRQDEPILAAASAASQPAWPAPTTMISYMNSASFHVKHFLIVKSFCAKIYS